MNQYTPSKNKVRNAVRSKWHLPEEKEWWYTKYRAVRRVKLSFLSGCQNHRCAVCNKTTWIEGFDARGRKSLQATCEHIKPQGEGGTDSLDNMIMTCVRCNNQRGVIDIYEFYDMKINNTFDQYQSDLCRNAANRAKDRQSTSADRAEKLLWWIACMRVVSSDFCAWHDSVLAEIQLT